MSNKNRKSAFSPRLHFGNPVFLTDLQSAGVAPLVKSGFKKIKKPKGATFQAKSKIRFLRKFYERNPVFLTDLEGAGIAPGIKSGLVILKITFQAKF